MAVYCAITDNPVVLIARLHQAVPGVHPSGLLHQRLQHAKFYRSKLELFFPGLALKLFGKQDNAPVFHPVFPGGSRLLSYPPEYSAYTRNDLSWQKGFANIIVSPHFQPKKTINFINSRSEHQDGYGRKLPDFPADGQAIFSRQHEIQDHKLGIIGFNRLYGTGSFMQHNRFKPVFFEVINEYLCDFFFIFYDDDLIATHVYPPDFDVDAGKTN